MGSVPVDASAPLIEGHSEVVKAFIEGRVDSVVERIVDCAIVSEWDELRAIVAVDLDEVAVSSSDAHELVAFCQMDVVPCTQLVSVSDVFGESEVVPIVFIDVGIFLVHHKANAQVVCQAEMRRDKASGLMGFLQLKHTSIEGVNIKLSTCFGED